MSHGRDHGGQDGHDPHGAGAHGAPDAGAHAAHGHHGDVRNPDYEGPDRHCLPPEVRPTLPQGIGFILLMAALAAGAAWLGVKLL